jgi:hypothetical protein
MQKMKTDFLSPSLSIGAGQKLHEKAYHNQPSLSTLSLSLSRNRRDAGQHSDLAERGFFENKLDEGVGRVRDSDQVILI